MTRRGVTAMVTGVGGGGHGEQILKALRLAETPYRIVGGDMTPYSAGLARVDHPYLLPPASSPRYVETLLKVCRRHGVEALFHGSEPELRAVSAARAELQAAGLLLPINPPEVIDLCMDKLRTLEFLAARGFDVPRFARIGSLDEAAAFDVLPAVLKPSVGGGGSAHVHLVQDRDELVAAAAGLLAVFPQFIVQEYVGTPDSEYTVGVLTDMDGKLLNSIAACRFILSALGNRIKTPNRTANAACGPTLAVSSGISQGRIGRFPEVTGPCEQIALALGARGPLNIQCRLVGSRVYVFEINPRFSGTTSLRAMVGYNEPDILVRKHLLGEEIPVHFPYREGTIVRGLAETLLVDPQFPVAEDLP